jgi:hypothetical protein
MKNRIAETEATANELHTKIEFKVGVISLVDDLLAATELLVSRESLLAKRRRLSGELSSLRLDLALAEQYLAVHRPSAQPMFIS